MISKVLAKSGLSLAFLLLLPCVSIRPSVSGQNSSGGSPIEFELKKIPFELENGVTPAKNLPETMLGGVAIFDYNGDGRPDIFFTNGANVATLKKDSPKFRNRLFRNDGNGAFTDVTDAAGLAGGGYDMGVAVGDYDNDGHPDLFVAGVHHSTLYHNNGDGTFTDVTLKSGLDASLNHPDPEFGPWWAITAVWVDVNNDGLLDLFVVDYLQWSYYAERRCEFDRVGDYCHPKFFKGQPNQLFLNNGDGTFRNVSKEWGLRDHVGKGMGVAMADYDLDGRPDLFVTNDASYNSLFHNVGNKFEEVAFEAGVALTEDGSFISGMGLDFRDFNNDGYPDLVFAALISQTFPIFQNTGKGTFREITTESGMREASIQMSGYGVGLFDFDNDGWKDLFSANGDVDNVKSNARQHDSMLRNLNGKQFEDVSAEMGRDFLRVGYQRGAAFGDLNNDGFEDIVVTSLNQPPRILMNSGNNGNHWLVLELVGRASNRDAIGAKVKLTTAAGRTLYDHVSVSVGFMSSSDKRVHFGLGAEKRIASVEIRWPRGAVQRLSDVTADQFLKVEEPVGK